MSVGGYSHSSNVSIKREPWLPPGTDIFLPFFHLHYMGLMKLVAYKKKLSVKLTGTQGFSILPANLLSLIKS